MPIENNQIKIKMKTIVFIYLFILTSTSTFGNYSLYEVTAFNGFERCSLYDLHLKYKNYNFLNGITNDAVIPMKVAVHNCYSNSFERKLQRRNIQFARVLDKIVIDATPSNSIPVKLSKAFYNWEIITKWIDKTIKEHTIIQKRVIGKSFENRDLFILKLSQTKKKLGVFILGGEEGRDWETPPIILNLMHLISEEKEGPESLTTYYDFYFLPFMNPDGYMYSRTKDRFWAKNRKTFIPQVSCPHNYTAIGVNVDRNWYFENNNRGSESKCNAICIGNSLSEEESSAVSLALNNLALNMLAFINLRGFQKLITIPYWNDNSSPNDNVVMELIASANMIVKEKYNVTYYVGRTGRVIYNLSGNIADWVKKMLNTPIVYTVYLKHEDDEIAHPSHINTLTLQFYTILHETLMRAKDIYDPIFNNASKFYKNETNVLLLITWITIINWFTNIYI